MKKCRICKIEKPLKEFTTSKKTKDGHTCYCKKCHCKEVTDYYKKYPRKLKNHNLKKTYGITIEDYEKLFNKQKGVCAICGKVETRICTQGMVQSLSVDHDHSTGLIRGLLCDRCNKAIGLLYHDTDLLIKATKYLMID